MTKLYALSGLREIENQASSSELIRFRSANKLLLAAHSQKELKILGNIVANRENLDFAEQALLYRRHLAEALKRPPKITLRAIVLMHSLGYFSDRLSHDEKAYFLQNIDRYKNKKLHFCPLDHAIRLDNSF